MTAPAPLASGPLVPKLVPRAPRPPRVPLGVVGRGAAARRLARRLLERQPRASLTALAGDEMLVVLGDENDLPWADGVVYLGRCEAAPSLWLPTHRDLSLPAHLVERAVLSRLPAGSAPVALLTDPPLLVPLGGARPLDRARLRDRLEEPAEERTGDATP